MEALLPSVVCDWAVSEPIDAQAFPALEGEKSSTEGEKAEGEGIEGVECLEWDADERIVRECQGAKERAGKLVGDSDAGVLWFEDYGVDWIKGVGKSCSFTTPFPFSVFSPSNSIALIHQ